MISFMISGTFFRAQDSTFFLSKTLKSLQHRVYKVLKIGDFLFSYKALGKSSNMIQLYILSFMIMSLSQNCLVKQKQQINNTKKSQLHYCLICRSSYKRRNDTKGKVILNSIIFSLHFYINNQFFSMRSIKGNIFLDHWNLLTCTISC